MIRPSLVVAAFGAALSAHAVSIDVMSYGQYTGVVNPPYDYSVDETVILDTATSLPALSHLHYDLDDTVTVPSVGTYTGAGGGFTFSFTPTTYSSNFGTTSTHGTWTLTSATGGFVGYAGGGTFSMSYDGVGTASYTTLVGDLQPVPEPASMAALGLGAVGLLRRRKRA